LTRETVQTDVLIVGGGGAAARAAYEAKRLEPDLDVTVVTEGKWGSSGSTVWVASETLGINAPLNAAEDGDSPGVFLVDILKTGLGLADRSLAAIIADESSDRILELIELGVNFDRQGDKIYQRKLSGCTKARSLAQGGQTGVSILSALKTAAVQKGVKVIENLRVLDLIRYEGEVWGASGLGKGGQIDIHAKAVILANGGAGAIFPHNINHASLRGDGFAMAYRAGARMTNMEFFQIGPGVVFPKFHFIIHSHMWNFCPRLRNVHGKEFLEDYLPEGISRDEVLSLKSMSFPFSVRTHARHLDISISKEILAGRGTANGGVFFDVNHIAENRLKEKAPITRETFLKHGIDLCRDQIEIAPLVQNFNGGVRIDAKAAATVPGLFAVGEVSGGVHGADRPGGNNLTDCQVFGYRGGRAAAVIAKKRSLMRLADIPKIKLMSPEKRARLEPIKDAMDRALMVVRHEKNLLDLIEKIEIYRKVLSPLDTETENFLLVAELFARSALFRKESRGIHYREDFPDTVTDFEKPTIVRKNETGEMTCALA
jgi:succinate dehydrogenase/fumarate reductase flavoprotein subunit